MKVIPILILLVGGLLAMSLLLYLKIYLRARRQDVPITFAEILSLKFNDYPPGLIVDAYVTLRCSDPDISIEKVKAAYKSAPDDFIHAALHRKTQAHP